MDPQADLGNHENSALAGVQVDQRDSKVSPLLPSQMRGSVGEDHLQRWSDLAIEKVPAARRAVRQAKNDMNVEACLAVVADGDISNRAQDFALFGDLDFFCRTSFRNRTSRRWLFRKHRLPSGKPR
jgi:hypothetical protein